MENNLNNIDHLFKDGLGSYTETPPPDVWDALEKRLDGDRRRRAGIAFRWPWFIALLFIAGLFGSLLALNISGNSIGKMLGMNSNTVAEAQKTSSDATSTASVGTAKTHNTTNDLQKNSNNSTVKHSKKSHFHNTITNNIYNTATTPSANNIVNPTSNADQNTNSSIGNTKTVSTSTSADDITSSNTGAVDIKTQINTTTPVKYVVKNKIKNNIQVAETEPILAENDNTAGFASTSNDDDEDQVTFGRNTSNYANSASSSSRKNQLLTNAVSSTSRIAVIEKQTTGSKNGIPATKISGKTTTPVLASGNIGVANAGSKAQHNNIDNKKSTVPGHTQPSAATLASTKNAGIKKTQTTTSVNTVISTTQVKPVPGSLADNKTSAKTSATPTTTVTTKTITKTVTDVADVTKPKVKHRTSKSKTTAKTSVSTTGSLVAVPASTSKTENTTSASATHKTVSEKVAAGKKIVKEGNTAVAAITRKTAMGKTTTAAAKSDNAKNYKHNITNRNDITSTKKAKTNVTTGSKTTETATVTGKTIKTTAVKVNTFAASKTQSVKTTAVAPTKKIVGTEPHHDAVVKKTAKTKKTIAKTATPSDANTSASVNEDNALVVDGSSTKTKHVKTVVKTKTKTTKLSNTTVAKKQVAATKDDDTEEATTNNKTVARQGKIKTQKNRKVSIPATGNNTTAIAAKNKNGNKKSSKQTPATTANEYSSSVATEAKPAATAIAAPAKPIPDAQKIMSTFKVDSTAALKPKMTETPTTSSTIAATDSPATKRKFLAGYEYGTKIGYEGGFNNKASQKLVISGYIEHTLKGRFSYMTQPAFKSSHVNSRSIDGTANYYDTTGTTINNTNYLLLVFAGDTLFRHNFTYTQKYDSLVKSYGIGGNYYEFELPLLLKYKVTDKLSVYGGVNIGMSKFIAIKERTYHSGFMDRSGDTLSVSHQYDPASAPSVGSVMKYTGTAIADYKGPLYPTQSGISFRLGYMLGFSYELKKRWLADVLVQQTFAKSNVQGGYNTNTALSVPYFRITLGYRLSK